MPLSRVTSSPADFGKFRKLDERMMQGADDALTQGALCWALRARIVCRHLLPPAAAVIAAAGIPVLLRQLGHEQDARAALEKVRGVGRVREGALAMPARLRGRAGLLPPLCVPSSALPTPAAPAPLLQETHESFMEGSSALPVSVSYSGSEGRMIAGGGGEPGGGSDAEPPAASAPASGAGDASNPFGGGGGGAGLSRDAQSSWAANINKKDSDSMFRLLPGGQEGKVTGAGAKDVLLDSGLDVAQLRLVWELSDIDRDGCLDADEFAVCQYLIRMAKAGRPLPASLPPNIVPPSKKK